MKSKIWLCLAALFVISGCASNQQQVKAEDVIVGGADIGYVALSMTYRGSYGEFLLRYSAPQETELQSLSMGAGMTVVPPAMLKWDIDVPHERGDVMLIAVKPGTLLFTSWIMIAGYQTIRSSPFQVPVDVKAGQITYVGNFFFNRRAKTDTGAEISLRQQASRDLPLLRSKYPALDKLPIVEGGSVADEAVGGSGEKRVDMPPIIVL